MKRQWIRVMATECGTAGMEEYEIHLPGAMLTCLMYGDGTANICTRFSAYMHLSATMTEVDARYRIVRLALGSAQEAGFITSEQFKQSLLLALTARQNITDSAKRKPSRRTETTGAWE